MMIDDNMTSEVDETREFERSLKEKMADSPHMSPARLVFAEMIMLCMTYRELLKRRSRVNDEGYENY
ncbi:MAG: hypothetical protein ABI347_08590 [Nitrososphaera sp.]|jgi:hypothetical protein